MSCPLSSLLRSLYSDWSRRPHDAGGFPGLLWGCARVPVHAGIGEYPFCVPHTHPTPCPRDPIEQMGWGGMGWSGMGWGGVGRGRVVLGKGGRGGERGEGE